MSQSHRTQIDGFSHLMEVILIQLAHKTGEVTVLEHVRQNLLREFANVLDNEAVSAAIPADDIRVDGFLENTRDE